MNKDLESVLKKVRALQALSQSSNVHEAAAAAAQADRLIQEYRISIAELEVTKTQAAEPIELIEENLYVSGRIMIWKKKLADVLCKHYGSTYYIDTVINSNKKGARGTEKAFKVAGTKSDFEVIKYMFAYLNGEIERLCKLEAYGKGHQYSQSYCYGAVQGIEDQLKKSIDSMRNESSSTAMILLDSRSQEASRFLNSKLSLKTAVSSKQRLAADGYATGRERGQNISLNAGLNPGSKNTKLLK